jgi:hypothetical protein
MKIIHKVTENPIAPPHVEPAPFSDEQIDIIAQVICELRFEFKGMLDAALDAAADKIVDQATDKLRHMVDTHAAIGELRAQLSVLIGSEKGFEVSETLRKLETTRKRKVRVRK